MAHVNRLVFFALLILSSCDNDDEQISTDVNELIGKWDAYRTVFPDGRSVDGFQYAVLMNYEHGFEVFENGTYKSRYANGTTFDEGFYTDSNSGKWDVKNDTLTFSHTFEKQTSSYHFLVIQADRSTLIIKFIGYDNWFDESIHKTRYLKKTAH
jgi:hypothetical protein